MSTTCTHVLKLPRLPTLSLPVRAQLSTEFSLLSHIATGSGTWPAPLPVYASRSNLFRRRECQQTLVSLSSLPMAAGKYEDSTVAVSATGVGSSQNVAERGEGALSKAPVSHKVAVIGAGAAGLVAARELLREGHEVVVLEQGTQVGGVWVFTEDTESDVLGTTSDRTRVHGSMYASLRTNLPREVMGYLDFPFLPTQGSDERRFPGHDEVLRYLACFAERFNLLPYVRFQTHVDLVAPVEEKEGEVRWQVRATKRTGDTKCPPGNNLREETSDELFDAVMICNGHFFEPRVADIPGVDSWPGRQIHSHNYRRPEPFHDQVVVVLGAGPSGEDISIDIARHARQVLMCSKTCNDPSAIGQLIPPHPNLRRQLIPTEARKDGSLVFPDGFVIIADVILHCTGYQYAFPFLDTGGYCQVVDNRVSPLYQHVFPPAFAASLSFIGLPFKVVPFPLMELQSRWVARLLSKKCNLPPREKMEAAVQEFYAELESRRMPQRFTHMMTAGGMEYMEWVADVCGCPPPERWRSEMYAQTSANKREDKQGYRDRWRDEDLRRSAIDSLREVQTAQVSSQ